MSLLAIGLAFAAASLILFGVSFLLISRLGPRRPGESPPPDQDRSLDALDRPWPI